MPDLRAIAVDPRATNALAVVHVDEPHPTDSEALVRVEASSLNRGDLLAAQAADPGWRPGHDVAGTVVRPAADGSGPGVGAKVAGLLDSGAWCEQVAVPTDRLAEMPDGVDIAEVSTLPTAGVTAMRALEQGGSLLGRRVLITGSTGGVGMFAHQLARAAGAFVVGTARRGDQQDLVRKQGADEVVVGDDISGAEAFGPYDLILESLGGPTLARVLSMVASGGTCVTFGWSASPTTQLDLTRFLSAGGRRLYGLRMPYEFLHRPASFDLAFLGRMLAEQRLDVRVEAQASWDGIDELAGKLLERTISGKAVFRL